MEKTTIPCLKETRNRLKNLARKNESWDEFLNRLADKFEEKEKTE
jgi:hypothetical protein